MANFEPRMLVFQSGIITTTPRVIEPCKPCLPDDVLTRGSQSVHWQNTHSVQNPGLESNFKIAEAPGASGWLSQERIHLQCRRLGFDPWVGRAPGEKNGKPLQYSCLENAMDRGAWRATYSPWGGKELKMIEQLTLQGILKGQWTSFRCETQQS